MGSCEFNFCDASRFPELQPVPAASEMIWCALPQHFMERTEDEHSPIDKIRHSILAYFEFFQRHPKDIEIVMMGRTAFQDTIGAT